MDVPTEANEGGASTVATPADGQQAEPNVGDRRAAIIAAVRAKQGGSEPSGSHTPVPAGSTPASATTDGANAGERPKPAATPDPRDAAIADLTSKLTALEAKLTAPAKTEEAKPDRYEALKAKLAKHPSHIFEEFPELGGLEKVSDDWLKRQDDPAYERTIAVADEVKELREKLAAKDKADEDAKKAAAADAAQKAGRDGVKGLVDADKARWPRISRDVANLDEAVGTAIAAAQKVAIKLGRDIPEEEARKIVADCLDDVEKDFAARAGRYALPDISAAPKPRAGLVEGGGSVGAVRDPAPPAAKLTKAQIIERVRKNARPTS